MSQYPLNNAHMRPCPTHSSGTLLYMQLLLLSYIRHLSTTTMRRFLRLQLQCNAVSIFPIHKYFPRRNPGPEDAKTTASILAGFSHKRREIGPMASCKICVASPCVPHVAWELAWSASPTRPFAARVLDADAKRRWGSSCCYMWHGARGSTSMSVRNSSAARNRSPAVIWPL
jgi:hypothetical protein